INVYSFFEMMATELTDDISEAEIIVTDKDTEAEICAKAKEAAEAAGNTEAKEGVDADRRGKIRKDAEIIREYDFEKMIALMN
ncbi:MAG: hypothetical protein K6G22_11290, partial [Lachnospiraceae bacterium]|nr:hypothetical protein [Lachnospiraceae bacterium]